MFLLADVPEENKFHLNNGKVLRNLRELALEFPEMNQDTFQHHVTTEKNDFSNWIKYTIKDAALANTIANIKDKGRMHAAITHRVRDLEKSYQGKEARTTKGKKH
jgi:hypothetical protein